MQPKTLQPGAAAKKKGKSTLSEEFRAELAEVDKILTMQNPFAAASSKKSSKNSANLPPKPPQPLTISRNKHWRYISCFHGPWLNIRFNLLEQIACINYNTPRPWPIDPAVLYELIRVRRLVEEAADLAVRAASDIVSPVLTNVNGGNTDPQDPLTLLGAPVSGHVSRLSRERKFRMREQACQKLARAYRLDEIACSVAVMQSATPLDDIGSLVLQRNPDDPDAKLVHFFHEKIPSRQIAESTSLRALNDIISERPNEVEVLRTRANVKLFKHDYEGAIQDLTLAFSGCQFHQPPRIPTAEQLQVQTNYKGRRRGPDVILSEKDQPSSLTGQLFFHRATAYLTWACRMALQGDWRSEKEDGVEGAGDVVDNGASASDKKKSSRQSAEDATAAQLEVRRHVKIYAKRALRDFLAYATKFEYSPNLPNKVIMEFNQRLDLAERRSRDPPADPSYFVDPYTTYTLEALFAAVPPSDLPPFPREPPRPDSGDVEVAPKTYEYVTYHPLLTDALHSILLCHCLLQTSAKELKRHALMVARLVHITEGSPIFQATRPASRTDWVDIISLSGDWLGLEESWDWLCDSGYPTDYREFHTEVEDTFAADDFIDDHFLDISEDARKERIHGTAMMDAMEDDRVHDNASFRAAIAAHTERLEGEDAEPGPAGPSAEGAPLEKQEEKTSVLTEETRQTGKLPTPSPAVALPDLDSFMKEFPEAGALDITPTEYTIAYNAAVNDLERINKRLTALADGRDLSTQSPRALAIWDWIREAPSLPAMPRKRKKRPTKKGKESVNQTLGPSMEKLVLNE